MQFDGPLNITKSKVRIVKIVYLHPSCTQTNLDVPMYVSEY
jgi:hypothetical protein